LVVFEAKVARAVLPDSRLTKHRDRQNMSAAHSIKYARRPLNQVCASSASFELPNSVYFGSVAIFSVKMYIVPNKKETD
jgi:hypothetical protein